MSNKGRDIATISPNPTFQIQNKLEQIKIVASDRIELAINLSKYRLKYLFETEPIPLIGKIYNQKCFDIFIKIACNKIKETDEKKYIMENSLYLYVYSDIWGFDELKDKIKQCWINDSSLLLCNDDNEQNSQFLSDIIDFLRDETDPNNYAFAKDGETLDHIAPIDFFVENINMILEKELFIGLTPEFLNLIIQKVDPTKLDSRIYFEFLVHYIEKAQERDDDLLSYASLIHYIDFDQLCFDDLKKITQMKFHPKYEEYFDFLTIRQFKSFAQKMIDENEDTKKAIQAIRDEIGSIKKQYDHQIRNIEKKQDDLEEKIKELIETNKKDVVNAVKSQYDPLVQRIKSNQNEIEELNKKFEKLEKIQKDESEVHDAVLDTLKKIESIDSKFCEMSKKYNISSYVVSSINQQFIPMRKGDEQFFKYTDNEVYSETILNDLIIEAELQNLKDEKCTFKPFLVNETNPIIYFQFNQENSNVQSSSLDLLIKEYEFEPNNELGGRQILSWCLEGYFPINLEDYDKFYDNPQIISDDNWFQISTHSVAEVSDQNINLNHNDQRCDQLAQDGNVYKCSLEFSPICKYVRFRMIRNSNDDNVLAIKRLKISGRVLHPFKL